MTTTIEGRFVEKKAFAFKAPESGVVSHVDLVVVEGIWDNRNHAWVDPPTISSGFGCVRPEAVAAKWGIALR